MTHRDAYRTQPTRQTNRPATTGARPAPAGAARGGFTKSELDLIHATAAANNSFICIECSVVPEGTFPPTPDGALRPEVARIIAGLRRDAQPAPRSAGHGTRADRAAARSAERPGPAGDRLAARVDAAPASRAVNAVAYDRAAYDLEASRHLAAAGYQVDLTAVADAVPADGLEAGRG
ncbi:hypothetical protein [Kineosporia sp. R_H_3]|uniref:hypothetical protein n=1 Tax=Kineosporia sp. R_H_3 TaxID=1961848 RepID=UPI000B4B7046|nr:hypothetical protein [Kineosporia sp. R_H_3]